MANGGYAPYDYAWKTRGWSVQNPGYTETSNTYEDPGLPDDVPRVSVFGSFLDGDTGRGLEGVLRVRTSRVLTHQATGSQVLPGVRRVRFQQDGFTINLPATGTAALGSEPWTYQAILTVNGIHQQFEFSLPSSPSSVNIVNLIPDSPEDPSSAPSVGPQTTDITILQGSDWAHGWRVRVNGELIDATWTVAAQIRAVASAVSPVLYQFPASVDAAGNAVLSVPHDDSSAWTFTSGVYDVEVTNADASITQRVAGGKVTVLPEVTRA